MTPGLFFLLLLPPLVAVAIITIRTCQHISAAGQDAQAIIRDNSDTSRNYARAQMEEL